MATISLQAAYDQARRWIESSDSERAIGLAQHILQQYPKNLEAYRILGEAYLASRQLDNAQQAFEQVLRSDPENIPAHVGLGITYERQGRLDKAVPEFEQAWEIKPDMTELRGQLLRLYTDAWGSEHAQLRLSRAGLARLYAKGHMLPQAIAEFRHVIVDKPERYDAKVALAEALWRDNQEASATTLAHDLLVERPETLKANLLLGYIALASGRPDGQTYWNVAHDMDPYQTVAQAMFDTLPQTNGAEPMIEAWDADAWQRAQRAAREHEELAAATRPIPVAAAVPASVPEEDTFGAWFDQPTLPPPPALRTVTPNAGEQEDFLAGLLGMGASTTSTASTPSSSATTELDDLDVTPFVFDTNETSAAPVPSAPTAPSSSHIDEPEMTPFSLADLGLSDEELAQFDEVTTPPVAQTQLITPPVSEPDEEPQLMPFSLADLGLSDDEIADLNTADDTSTASSQPSTPPAPEPDDEPQLTPFSLADLGLSDDEIASLNTPDDTSSTAPPAPEPDDEPQLTPFSLADLGLSDDEIASLNAADDVSPTAASPSTLSGSTTDDEPQLTPFSLADLGLSDDETASLNVGDAPQTAPVSPSTPSAPESDDDEPQLTPFSLADLGLSDDDIASLNSISETAQADTPRANTSYPASNFASSAAPEEENDFGELPVDLRPFSLDELDLSSLQSDDDMSDSGGFPSSLQPFSLDDMSDPSPSPSRSQEETFGGLNLTLPEEDESPSQSGGYSFRQPNQRTRPGFLKPESEAANEGLSIFAKLKQRKQSEPAPTPEPLPDVSGIEDDQKLFSLDDVSLRDEAATSTSVNIPTSFAAQSIDIDLLSVTTSAPTTPIVPAVSQEQPQRVESQNLSEAMSSGQIQPFSLADLGLSDDEIAALGFGATESAPTEPTPQATSTSMSQSHDTGFTPATTNIAVPAQTTEIEDLSDALMSGDVQPFSFADLGLSDEEIASFGLDASSSSATAPSTSVQPSDHVSAPTEPNVPTQPAEIEDLSDALTSGDVQPFSFADLGLSDEEIALFGLDEPSTSTFDTSDTRAFELDAQTSAATDEEEQLTTDLQPFSLTDLGLSDEEISQFDFGDVDEPTSAGLGITEEDLAGLDLGEMEWNQPETPAEVSLDPSTTAPEITPYDPIVERLIALGQRQGYVDVNDIITGVESPEAEEEHIEEIINQLQAANIEIRDGDERIDLDADEEDYDDSDLTSIDFGVPAQPTPLNTDEPEMTPFSLADLGLSDDEIAAFNLDETDASAVPALTLNDEPDLTPFSFADLGLSDDEIASLNFDEAGPVTPTSSTSDEPEMTPFSLADLGLSDDEIASLNLDEAAPTAPASPASDEPEMTPFSLADLGLSDDEIASLNLDEAAPTASASPASDEPEMTPFSLADLGLSDDEIASLNLDEAPASSTPIPPTSDDEPEMTPFSLADLGLSDDEIASLNLDEAVPTAPASSASDELEMTPFSLADLGLSDDEIASLNLDEITPSNTSPPSVAGEPEMTPFSLADLGLSDTEAQPVPEIPDPEPVEAQPVTQAPASEPIAQSKLVPTVTTGAQPAPATPIARPTPKIALTNNPAIDAYIRRLDAEPQNHVLRLAVARLVGQAGMVPLAIQQYKQLIRQDVLLDNVISELTDLLEEVDDQQTLLKVHRTLGDAYSKQGMVEEAITEYSWLPETL